MDSKLLKKVNSWHERAQNEEDPFVQFIFDYLAFVAIINQRYSNERDDRHKIQALKRDETIKSTYLNKLSKNNVQKIIKTLDVNPITNETRSNRYWTCKNRQNEGKINSPEDFRNMVEFIYLARNNLFHGKKGYEINRDILIMEYGFVLIDPLVDVLIIFEGVRNGF
jgi:hypothetical protein